LSESLRLGVMIVCLCANVSEKKLGATIDGGASTLREVGRRCGAGVACGSCRQLIRENLRRHHAASAKSAEQVIVEAGEATSERPLGRMVPALA